MESIGHGLTAQPNKKFTGRIARMNSEQKFPYDFIGEVLISQQEIETAVSIN